MQQTTPRLGRPRSPEVIDRDEQVYRLIAEGIGSRSALAAATGLDRPTVTGSVQRLKKAGRIRPCWDDGAAVWAIADGTPCP
jgi:DNA invertase Pin-like site-specific DNA recombinase